MKNFDSPKKPDSYLIRSALGAETARLFEELKGEMIEDSDSGTPGLDLGTGSDLSAFNSLEAEKNLEVWDRDRMIRWVEEELKEQFDIQDPEIWVDDYCRFTDEGIIGVGAWWLTFVTSFNSFPKLINHEGNLYLDKLNSAEQLNLERCAGLQELYLNSLISPEKLDLSGCSGLNIIKLGSLASVNGLKAPDDMRGTDVYLSRSAPDDVKDFFRKRGANIM